MKFTESDTEYYKHQGTFVKALAGNIKRTIDESDREDLEETLLFGICSLIDGISSETGDTIPFITFGSLENEGVFLWNQRASLHEVCQEFLFESEVEDDDVREIDDVETVEADFDDSTFEVFIKFGSGIKLSLGSFVADDLEYQVSDAAGCLAFAVTAEFAEKVDENKKINAYCDAFSSVVEVSITKDDKPWKTIHEANMANLSAKDLMSKVSKLIIPR